MRAQLHCDGADGCQLETNHRCGAGPRQNVLPPLPAVVWDQTPPQCRNYSSGERNGRYFNNGRNGSLQCDHTTLPSIPIDSIADCTL